MPENTDKFESIIQLTQRLQQSDTEEALEFAKQGLALAQEQDEKALENYIVVSDIYREIKEQVGLAHKAGVHCIIRGFGLIDWFGFSLFQIPV